MTQASTRAIDCKISALSPKYSVCGPIRSIRLTGALPLHQAGAILQEAEALMRGAEYEVASDKVLELVQTSPCSAYDCEFVALAHQLGVKLVTMDGKVLRAFAGDALPLSTNPS